VQANFLTTKEKVVLSFRDGAEFQRTIVRSRRGRSRPFSARAAEEGTRTSPATCTRALTPKSCAHEGLSRSRALLSRSRQSRYDKRCRSKVFCYEGSFAGFGGRRHQCCADAHGLFRWSSGDWIVLVGPNSDCDERGNW
jgi:hypothetical protein